MLYLFSSSIAGRYTYGEGEAFRSPLALKHFSFLSGYAEHTLTRCIWLCPAPAEVLARAQAGMLSGRVAAVEAFTRPLIGSHCSPFTVHPVQLPRGPRRWRWDYLFILVAVLRWSNFSRADFVLRNKRLVPIPNWHAYFSFCVKGRYLIKHRDKSNKKCIVLKWIMKLFFHFSSH